MQDIKLALACLLSTIVSLAASANAVRVDKDIVFAEAEGYWTSLEGAEAHHGKVFSQGYLKSFKKRELQLTLDLYRPENLNGRRPLILFIHGGGFYVGHKAEPAYVDFCTSFAEMGCVTASINYRLGYHIGKQKIERAGYAALQDAHAALRFLVSHAEEYNIDPGRVYISGSSAGAIIAFNLAFMNNECRPESSRGKQKFLDCRPDMGDIESSGNDLKADFKIVAIANMWGGMYNPEMLANGDAAIVSFHGTDDPVMPCEKGYPMMSLGKCVAKMLSDEVYGSEYIDKKAGELGLRHRLYLFPGEKHALNTTGKDKMPNDNHKFIKEKMAAFFFDGGTPADSLTIEKNKTYE